MTNASGPATSRQLWALFCATKEDHRDKGLSKQEASDILNDHNKRTGYSAGKCSAKAESKPDAVRTAEQARHGAVIYLRREEKAFDRGYVIGFSATYAILYRQGCDLLQHAVDAGEIEPNGWELFRNFEGISTVEELGK